MITVRKRCRWVVILTTGILLLAACSEIYKLGAETISYNITKAGNENKGPVPVLIISYMRSGSTFTSDVIASHPSSYYIFEPLIHSIPKTQNVGRKIELINGTIITSDDEAVLVSNFLFSWLTCQYDGLDKKSVLSLTHTNTTTPFKMCLKKGKSNNNETILQTCLKVLQKKCESSQIRLVKTIRTRMRTSVEILLKRIPGLKVLHLFRDQRPRLLSAEKTPMMAYLNLQKTAKLECSRVSDDIAMHQMLKKQHPGRLKTLLYERLAESPLWVAKRIFDFLLLPLTRESVEHIQSITSSSREVRCYFCTKRANSSKTAHAWRTKNDSNFKKIKMIELECRNSQNVLGYLPITNIKELRNISINLRVVTPFTADAL